MFHLSSYQWLALCIAAALFAISTSACSCTNQQSRDAQQTTRGGQSNAAEVESGSTGSNAIGPEKVALPKPANGNNSETTSSGSSSLNKSKAKENSPTKDSARPSPVELAGDPGEAKRSAREFATAAKQKADNGSFSDAFLDARNAWSLVSQFPNDTECSKLAAELIIEMRSYAAQSNHGTEGNTEGKILIVK